MSIVITKSLTPQFLFVINCYDFSKSRDDHKQYLLIKRKTNNISTYTNTTKDAPSQITIATGVGIYVVVSQYRVLVSIMLIKIIIYKIRGRSDLEGGFFV